MIKFEKVPFEEYLSARTNGYDCTSEDKLTYKTEWDNIKLPRRGTAGSGGYDFFIPYDCTSEPSSWTTVCTGIRFVTDESDKVLFLAPRSGLGFKFKFRLANTLGVIDSDYHLSDNFGHIKVCFKSERCKEYTAGDAILQGIISQYFVTDDDNATEIRNGGFGSTDRK